MIDSNTAVDALLVGLVGAAAAVPMKELAIGKAPESLMRTNVDGRAYPRSWDCPWGSVASREC